MRVTQRVYVTNRIQTLPNCVSASHGLNDAALFPMRSFRHVYIRQECPKWIRGCELQSMGAWAPSRAPLDQDVVGEEFRRGGRTPVQLGARRMLVREGAYKITYPQKIVSVLF